MFFYASKILWFFATPSNLIPALALLGVLLLVLTPLRRTGLVLSFGALAGLFLFGLSPLATLALRPLEARFPIPADDGRPVDGIIILGGALDPDKTATLGHADLNEAGERILVGAELALRHPQARILLSGGSGLLRSHDNTEADATLHVYAALGIDPARMIIENRSRNTHENAVFSREAARPREGENWLLVTSAWHMPRSVGVFRQAGFAVTPYPVDFRTMGGGPVNAPFASVSDGLRRLDVAMREWAGLVVYRLTGRTDALLPGPEDRPGGRP